MKVKVIINSETRMASRRRLDDVLTRGLAGCLAGIEWTCRSGDATTLARRGIQQGADTIVAVGGDGTVNEVVRGIIGSDVALGVIPGGTANDLGAWHRLPRCLDEACRAIRARHVRAIDVIRVNEKHTLVTAGGIGLPGDITRIASIMRRRARRRRRLLPGVRGSGLYVLAALRAALRGARSQRLMIRWGGSSLVTRPHTFLVANQPVVGGRFRVAPGARNDDGLLDFCLIEPTGGPGEALGVVRRALGGTLDRSPGARRWRAREVVLGFDRPVTFVGDGESLDRDRCFRIRVLPRALALIVPAGRARR